MQSIQLATFDVDALRTRLRKMSDKELREFGTAARHMVSPRANMGKPPLPAFVLQLEEARARVEPTSIGNRLSHHQSEQQSHSGQKKNVGTRLGCADCIDLICNDIATEGSLRQADAEFHTSGTDRKWLPSKRSATWKKIIKTSDEDAGKGCRLRQGRLGCA